MELVSEGNNILTEIQRSIQNAFAMLKQRDYFGSRDQLLSIDDDAVVSAYDTKEHKPTSGGLNFSFTPSPKPLSFPKEDVNMYNQTKILLSTPRPNSAESLHPQKLRLSPFSNDPIKNTVEEMQRVLNAKGDGFPRVSETSPEEILNLYSKDLGISLSNSCSPRGDAFQRVHQQNMNDTKSRQNKKDKKDLKGSRQSKSKLGSENKPDSKKRKATNLEMIPSKENRLKDLMNIYAGSKYKTKERNSDSTLDSKSELMKTKSLKKAKQKNGSSKASSIALSKKSKKKSKKYLNKAFDDELIDAEFLAQEKLSKLGDKKRNIKKRSNLEIVKLQKKVSSKKSSFNNKDTSHISKSNQTYYGDIFIDSKGQKLKKSKFAGHYQSKQNSCRVQNAKINQHGKPFKAEKEILQRNKSKTLLNELCQNNLIQRAKNNFNNLDMLNINVKSQTHDSKELQLAENKTKNDFLSCEEPKLKKHVVFPEISEKSETSFVQETQGIQNLQSNIDNLNGDFLYEAQGEQQHYTLPTQSSRMKEVERFLNGRYQHLPFVIGQSTNKSHNLWVNIQEALSLINQKLPQCVEVQSSAVNECAESERPPSVISKLTTNSVRKPHQCPAITSNGLYDIPEGSTEVDDDVVKSWEDHPECIKANADPNYVRSRCSCSLQPMMSYKKVLKQIFGKGCAEPSESSLTTGVREDWVLDQGGDSYIAELRKALISFSEDFEKMNNKYEEMLMDPNADKEELKLLEVQLENKEEEIKEILTKFNEVKDFQEKAHLEGTKSRPGFYSLEPFKSTTSIRLAQTLHRVQKFKESLKSRPSVNFLVKHNHNLCY